MAERYVVYNGSFLVSGMMCHKGCATNVKNALSSLCPPDMELFIEPCPHPSGQMQIRVIIRASNRDAFIDSENTRQSIEDTLFETLAFARGKKEDNAGEQQKNIAVGVAGFLAITLISLLFPPSLLLTSGLSLTSILTTTWMARDKIRSSFAQWRLPNLWTMEGTITIGWFLSILHTVYHVVSMPLIMGFSMVFMSYLMPVLLFTLLCGMDEFKRRLIQTSATMALDSVEALFPGLQETYEVSMENTLENTLFSAIPRFALQKGMYISVPTDAVFPVDGTLCSVYGLIDESSLTGEPIKKVHCSMDIKSGSINKGDPVCILATEDPYNSVAYKLLFDTHLETTSQQKNVSGQATFLRAYGWIVAAAIIVAIAVPVLAGTATIPLLLESIAGILFSVCPCTVVLAFELPPLFSMYQRQRHGVTIRNATLVDHDHPMDTVIFDKTGTLTTGASVMGASYLSSPELVQRVSILEQTYGGGHPIAKAIIAAYPPKTTGYSMLSNDVNRPGKASVHGGIVAFVQNKKLAVGNAAFVRQHCKNFDTQAKNDLNREEIKRGETPVFVVEDYEYKGVIFIQHTVDEHMIAWVKELHREEKKLILLTGDTKAATESFLKQHQLEGVFTAYHTDLKPKDKKDKVAALMEENKSTNEGCNNAQRSSAKTDSQQLDVGLGANRGEHRSLHQVNEDANEGCNNAQHSSAKSGVWMIGDGANELLAFNLVRERGGVTCAIGEDTPARFCADICLSRETTLYPAFHEYLNHRCKRYISHNKMILLTSTLLYSGCVIGASFIGCGIPAIAGVLIMMLTTAGVLFHSQQMTTDVDKMMYDCRRHTLPEEDSLSSISKLNRPVAEETSKNEDCCNWQYGLFKACNEGKKCLDEAVKFSLRVF